MPAYLYRAVLREPDGTLGPTLHSQVIEAPDADAAIAIARTIYLDMTALGANAVYLTAPEDGRAIWSLHTGSPASA
ncbi:MAG: hypothetical protein INR70_13740 [Parafilimonas terrae]|nr:hypothetical protein [Parafilimonas terrae]